MSNVFGITTVRRAAKDGPWVACFCEPTGWVYDARRVGEMQRVVENSGGLAADVVQLWPSTPVEQVEAAATPAHLKDIGEKVIRPWRALG